jgi:hypothetical protein
MQMRWCRRIYSYPVRLWDTVDYARLDREAALCHLCKILPCCTMLHRAWIMKRSTAERGSASEPRSRNTCMASCMHDKFSTKFSTAALNLVLSSTDVNVPPWRSGSSYLIPGYGGTSTAVQLYYRCRSNTRVLHVNFRSKRTIYY